MSRLRQGILVGFVLSLLIVLLIALNVSDERRRQLSQRLKELRKTLPGVEQLKQSVQQAATKARETGSNLGEQVQESASKLARRTQEVVSSAQQAAVLLEVNRQTKSTNPVEESADQATE